MARLEFISKGFGYEGYALTNEVTAIGRGAHNAIVINDNSISRDHCRIERKGHHYYIHDLNSTNGVYVNNKRIRIPTEIRTGDRIQLGCCLTIFHKEKEEEGKSADTLIGEVAHDMEEKHMGYSTFMAKVSEEALVAEVKKEHPQPADQAQPAGLLKKIFRKKEKTKKIPFVPICYTDSIPREKVISEQSPKHNEKVLSVSKLLKGIEVCEIINYCKERYYVLSIDRNERNRLYQYHLKKC